MTEEQKEGSDKSCCVGKGSCCHGRRWLCCLLTGLLLAGAGFGLFQAGKCVGRHCETPAAASVQK